MTPTCQGSDANTLIAAGSIACKVPLRVVQEWASQKDVVYARPLASAGSRVTSVQDGLPTWVAEIMVVRPTMQAALEFVRKVETEIDRSIQILPGSLLTDAHKAVPDCLESSFKGVAAH